MESIVVYEWDILGELAEGDDIQVPIRMCTQAMSAAEIAAITTPSQRATDMRATIATKYQYTKTVQAMIAANTRGLPCAVDLSDKAVRKLTVVALYRAFGASTAEKFYPNNKFCEDYAIEQFSRVSTSGQFEPWIINTLALPPTRRHLLQQNQHQRRQTNAPIADQLQLVNQRSQCSRRIQTILGTSFITDW